MEQIFYEIINNSKIRHNKYNNDKKKNYRYKYEKNI